MIYERYKSEKVEREENLVLIFCTVFFIGLFFLMLGGAIWYNGWEHPLTQKDLMKQCQVYCAPYSSAKAELYGNQNFNLEVATRLLQAGWKKTEYGYPKPNRWVVYSRNRGYYSEETGFYLRVRYVERGVVLKEWAWRQDSRQALVDSTVAFLLSR